MQQLLRLLQTIELQDLITGTFVLGLPTIFCLLLWLKSPLVNSKWRMLGAFVLLSVFGEAVVVASLLINPPENGFSSLCGLCFGWAYVWVVGIPILLLSFVLRCLIGLWDRICFRRNGNTLDDRKRRLAAVAILVLSMVLYSIFLCVRPSAAWRDWGDRQYRVLKKDNLVHIEIEEGESITDVDTRASVFGRYAVEVFSRDELLLKSSDIGSWLIGKQGGRWRVYVRENGEVRCIDNEILKAEE